MGILESIQINKNEAKIELFEENNSVKSAFSGNLQNPCESCAGKCKTTAIGSKCDIPCIGDCEISNAKIILIVIFPTLLLGLAVFIIWKKKVYVKDEAPFALNKMEKSEFYCDTTIPLPMTPFSQQEEIFDQLTSSSRHDSYFETGNTFLEKRFSNCHISESLENIIPRIPCEITGNFYIVTISDL